MDTSRRQRSEHPIAVRRPRSFPVVFVALAALGCATPRHDRRPPALITGLVVDAAKGVPIAGAVVTLHRRGVGRRTAVTQADGAFAFSVPAGEYEIIAVKPEWDLTAAVITAGGPRLRIVLRPHEAPPVVCSTPTPPVLVSGPNPSFTEDALREGASGRVTIKCNLTTDGVLRACTVLKSIASLDLAVVDALESRRYRPALCAGTPVAVDFTFRLNFSLP